MRNLLVRGTYARESGGACLLYHSPVSWNDASFALDRWLSRETTSSLSEWRRVDGPEAEAVWKWCRLGAGESIEYDDREHRCVGCGWLKPASFLDEVTVGADTFYVCGPCQNNLAGPGKHELVHESDRALCVVLEHLASESGEDWMLTDEWQGYAGQFDRYVLLEDSRGFVEVREYDDAATATREMQDWEDEGFGASEWDAWISEDRGGYAVTFEGKYVDTFPRLNRAKAKVSLLMRDSGYYPNAFLQDARGTVRRVDVRYLEEVSK